MLRLAVFTLLVAAAAAASVATEVIVTEVNPLFKATPGTRDIVEGLVSCGSKGILRSIDVDRCMRDLHVGDEYTFHLNFTVFASHSYLTFTISVFANNKETVVHHGSDPFAFIAGNSYGIRLATAIPQSITQGDVLFRFKIYDPGMDEVCSLAPAFIHHST